MNKNKNETAALVQTDAGSVNYWENKQKLIRLFQKRYGLSDDQFQVFCAFGYSLRANPYAGEIIPVVFNRGQKNEKLSFILTRDFRGRIAQEQPDYLRHFVTDVCENDNFSMDAMTGMPAHTYDETSDRGKLIGAYCAVWKTTSNLPAAYQFAKYSQYKKTGPGAEIWDHYPNDQIKKVAEAHALRQAYYNKFGNTYDAAEIQIVNGRVIDTVSESDEKQKNKYKAAPPTKEATPLPKVTDEMKLELEEEMRAHLGERMEQFISAFSNKKYTSTSGITNPLEFATLKKEFEAEKEKGAGK